MDDRVELVRQMLEAFEVTNAWRAVMDDDVPPALAALQNELLDAYDHADVEWLLEHTHPDVEIAQLRELPDGRVYHGHDGFLDALLDWPLQWEDFRIEPVRVFAVGDEHLVTVGVHRGRPRTFAIEVAAEIVWVMSWRNGLMTHWDMYSTVEEAVAAAQSR